MSYNRRYEKYRCWLCQYFVRLDDAPIPPFEDEKGTCIKNAIPNRKPLADPTVPQNELIDPDQHSKRGAFQPICARGKLDPERWDSYQEYLKGESERSEP